jgi:hypothetical protein
MEKDWNECPAFARHMDDHGRERTVFCDLPLHAAPADATAVHWDDHLDIYWYYADGAGYGNDE